MYTGNWLFHDSHDLKFRNPFGAVPCEEKIALKLEIFGEVETVHLRLWKNHQEELLEMNLEQDKQESKIFVREVMAPTSPGQLWYYFIVNKKGKKYYYGNNDLEYGGKGKVWDWEPPSYQITVYKKGAETPAWFKEKVMYQIFVDRFYNGFHDKRIVNKKKNKYQYFYRDWQERVPPYKRDLETNGVLGYDIYGGNLLGVIKKLPYLKELGIGVVYLNPIFEAPSNHKYDTSDYKKIDPMFGDNELFQELCIQASQLGIEIILDGVFSHTGSDSVYFNKEGNYDSIGAYQSVKSPYYSWYSFQRHCDEYHCWWGIETLPNVNEMDQSYRDFIIYDEDSVIKYWMKLGAKGWRLDVADELPDQFIKELRTVMKDTDPESVLIGEVWEDASRKVSYNNIRQYLLGEELDSVMNYPFRNILLDFFINKITALTANRALLSIKENYPKHNFYANMNLLGSHDVPRILTLLGNKSPMDNLSEEEQAHIRLSTEQKCLALKRLKLLALVQMTFPGVPCIYYGDEAGMEGYKDPFNRGPYPWGQENTELLQWYKTIIQLRNNNVVLQTGQWWPLDIDQEVLGFIRIIENGKDIFGEDRANNLAVTLINRNTEKTINFSLDLDKYTSTNQLTDVLNNEVARIINGKLEITLPPLGGRLLLENT